MSFGRGGTYPVWLLFYVLAAILSAKAPNYESYAVGYMLHMFAQTGVNTMNDVLAADMSTARQRDFAVQLLLHVVYYIPWLFGSGCGFHHCRQSCSSIPMRHPSRRYLVVDSSLQVVDICRSSDSLHRVQTDVPNPGLPFNYRRDHYRSGYSRYGRRTRRNL